MKGKNKHPDEEFSNDNTEPECVKDTGDLNNESTQTDDCEQQSADSDELAAIKAELEAKTKKCDEYYNMLQRNAAEFDNFKKRTSKEKEVIYSDAVADVVSSFIPVVDNLERALSSSCEENSSTLREGIELVLRQVQETLKKINVEEIKAVGESFDPQLHNAVMHVEEDTVGEGIVVEEFQKGYIFKDRVIRHSMVKVAN